MYHVTWKLSALAVLFLVNLPTSESRNVTHEDIRDAVISLIHMFRTSEDKLERHEYREKALGEQLKKSLSSLDKKHRALEPLKGALSRLDERLSNVETILMQKEEREKSIQHKTNDALQSIQNSIQLLAAKLGKSQVPNNVPVENNLTTNNDSDSRLALLEEAFNRKIEVTNAKLDGIKEDISRIKDSFSKEALKAVCQDLGPDGKPLGRHLTETEKLLNKYELKLSEYNANASRIQTDFVPLSEITLSDEAWHSKMTDVMEKQEKEIQKIHKVLSDAEGLWKGLPTREDIKDSTNKTVEAVKDARYTILSSGEQANTKLVTKLNEMSDRTKETNEDIQKSLTEGNTMTEHMYGDVSRSYEQLRGEVQALNKVERVMLQTADNVMDTKKRIEYGVHQILLEVGDLIKVQGKTMNKTINDRFDNIESTIMDNQTGALANISSKIETEMSQVWRQIGIMYQQLTASKTSLDRLQKQTEAYVNGSAITMDSMENKVGLITSRMSEVDENLNYLLGRLSLVTQEFNQIKLGLGDALDNIKTSFLTVQAKLKDAGPGPHDITSAEVKAN